MERPNLFTVATAALLVAVGSLAGGGVTLLLTAGMVPSPTPGSLNTDASAAGHVELAASIRALADEVRRMRDQSATAASAEGATGGRRSDAPSPSFDSAQLQKLAVAVDRLTTALGSMTGGSAGTIIKAPTPHNTNILRGERDVEFTKMLGRDEKEVAKEYAFMTYQHILDRFGPPDEMTAKGEGLTFIYEIKIDRDGRQSEEQIRFSFVDGFVVLVRFY